MRKINKYIFWWGVAVADAILYGIISSYIGEGNLIMNVWAVLRYVIMFISAIGIEKECEKISMSLRSKMILVPIFICMLGVLLLGYFLSTLSFFSFKFMLSLLCLTIVSIAGGMLLHWLFKISLPNEKKIIILKDDEVDQRLEQIMNTGDINKINLVKGMACLGGAMFTLSIVYLVIPIFIRNTDINLTALYELGFIFFVLFMFFNFKKYHLISSQYGKSQYYIETGIALIGSVLMYYVDGFIYRGIAATNFVLNFAYVLCLIPFLISTKKISVQFYQELNEIDK